MVMAVSVVMTVAVAMRTVPVAVAAMLHIDDERLTVRVDRGCRR